MSKKVPHPNMTVDEYLRFEESSNCRHEFVEGQVFAMTGSTEAHNVICVNLLTRIHSHLRGTGCRAFINDMKVHVKAANSFYYPDIMVTCEPFQSDSVFKSSPVLLVEVLSKSTRQVDKREKLVAYRKLSTLQEYVIVHQYKMFVELYSKDADGTWQCILLSRSDELVLRSLPGGDLTIPVGDIYETIDIPLIVEEENEEYEFVR